LDWKESRQLETAIQWYEDQQREIKSEVEKPSEHNGMTIIPCNTRWFTEREEKQRFKEVKENDK